MKINESTLISYATSASCPTDKEGWLWKRGEVNKSFQKRYFVLKGNLLFYFEKKTDKEPIGVIILEGCTIELAEEEQEMFAFKINFHGEGRRVYYLGTDNQDTLEEWMKFLASSSYDYMKLMVLELQQKLAELDEQEKIQLKLKQQQQQQQQQQSQNSQAKMTTSNSGEFKRTNPFNKADTLAISESKQQSATMVSNWCQLHQNYGAKISNDRDRWCLGLLERHQ